MKNISIVLALLIILNTALFAKEIAFTEKDREMLINIEKRLIKLETKLDMFMDSTNKRFEDINKRFEDINKRFEDINKRFEDMNKRFEELREDMNKRFEQVDKRFEQMMNFLWIITGIFTTLTLGVIGFAYWDRRTIIRRAKEETIEQLEKEGKLKNLIDALKEKAKTDKELAQILRQYNLL